MEENHTYIFCAGDVRRMCEICEDMELLKMIAKECLEEENESMPRL
jgi:hypothetical protein